MADKNISDKIMAVCKEQGIKYTSINPNYNSLCNDAKELGELIRDILAMIDRMDTIFSRHDIKNGFGEKLRQDIENLHETEHDLFRLSCLIKDKNKNEQETL